MLTMGILPITETSSRNITCEFATSICSSKRRENEPFALRCVHWESK